MKVTDEINSSLSVYQKKNLKKKMCWKKSKQKNKLSRVYSKLAYRKRGGIVTNKGSARGKTKAEYCIVHAPDEISSCIG